MKNLFKFFKLTFLVIFGNKVKRYHSIHTLLSLVSIQFGFRLGNKDLVWHEDEEFFNSKGLSVIHLTTGQGLVFKH